MTRQAVLTLLATLSLLLSSCGGPSSPKEQLPKQPHPALLEAQAAVKLTAAAYRGDGAKSLKETDDEWRITLTSGATLTIPKRYGTSRLGVVKQGPNYYWAISEDLKGETHLVANKEGNFVPLLGKETIGIATEGKQLYWTLDGEAIRDREGDRIPVVGALIRAVQMSEGRLVVTFDSGAELTL